MRSTFRRLFPVEAWSAALWASIALALVVSIVHPREALPGEQVAFLQGLLAFLALIGKGAVAAGGAAKGAALAAGPALATGAKAAGGTLLGIGQPGAGLAGQAASAIGTGIQTGGRVGLGIGQPGMGMLGQAGGALSMPARYAGRAIGPMMGGGGPPASLEAANPAAQAAMTSPGAVGPSARSVLGSLARAGNQFLGAMTGQPGGLIPGMGQPGPFTGPGGVPATPPFNPSAGPPSPGELERIGRSGMGAVGGPPVSSGPPVATSGLQTQLPLPERIGRGVSNALQTFVFGPDHRNLSSSDKAAVLAQSVLAGIHKNRTGQGMGAIPYAQSQARQIGFDRQMDRAVQQASSPAERQRLEMLRYGVSMPQTQDEWMQRQNVRHQQALETVGAQAAAYRKSPEEIEAEQARRIARIETEAEARARARAKYPLPRTERTRASDLAREDRVVAIGAIRRRWSEMTPEEQRKAKRQTPDIDRRLFEPIPGESQESYDAWINSLTGAASGVGAGPPPPGGGEPMPSTLDNLLKDVRRRLGLGDGG